MKKNRTLKLASGLLILCLITTCAISTTLAKYTTGDTASDTARVAKWGVEISTTGTLFSNAYTDAFAEADNNVATVLKSGVADAFSKVVAPGTKNEVGVQFKLHGQPEVDFKVIANNNSVPAKDIFLGAGTWGSMVKIPADALNYTTDFSQKDIYTSPDGQNFALANAYDPLEKDNYYKLVDTVVLAADYYPIVWTVTGTDSDASLVGKNLVDIMEAIIKEINNNDVNGKIYQANDLLDETYTITWAWAYEAGNDKADTVLGNLMAENTATQYVVKLSGVDTYTSIIAAADYSLEVAYGLAITATQLN